MIIRFQRVCNEEHQLMRCIYNYKCRVLKKAGDSPVERELNNL